MQLPTFETVQFTLNDLIGMSFIISSEGRAEDDEKHHRASYGVEDRHGMEIVHYRSLPTSKHCSCGGKDPI